MDKEFVKSLNKDISNLTMQGNICYWVSVIEILICDTVFIIYGFYNYNEALDNKKGY